MQQACACRFYNHAGRYRGDILARSVVGTSLFPTAALSIVCSSVLHVKTRIRQEKFHSTPSSWPLAPLQRCPSRLTPQRLSRQTRQGALSQNHPSTIQICAATRLAAMTSAAATSFPVADVTHLTQQEAIAVDEELFSSLGFSVDQLMVSCCCCC